MQERLQWFKNTIEVWCYIFSNTLKHSNTSNSKLSGNYPHQHPNLKIHPKVRLVLRSLSSLPYILLAISSTLQTQHAIFVSLAARTAAVDAEVQKVKTLYTQLWRAKTGSMRDPFNELDRGSGGDFGMESLQVKWGRTVNCLIGVIPTSGKYILAQTSHIRLLLWTMNMPYFILRVISVTRSLRRAPWGIALPPSIQ
jgi:hypothetical protein